MAQTDRKNSASILQKLRRQRALLWLLLGCVVAFCTVSVLVSRHVTIGFDLYFQKLFRQGPQVFRFLVRQMDRVISPKHDLIAALTLSVLIVTGGAILHVLRSGVRDAVLFSGTTIVSFLLNLLLKPEFARIRPDRSFGFSYPSDHAMMAFAFFIPIACILARHFRSRGLRAFCWAVGVLFTLGVGMSRVVIGRHFMSDIVGGYLLSAAVFLLFLVLVRLLDRPVTPLRARLRKR